ncbi:MAG: hypothetical protein RLZZ393_1732, partial [Pseudomonadota bacterium]
SPRGLATAIGLGLLIGVVRERLHKADGATIAGIRTHALVAIVTAVATGFGLPALVAVMLLVGGLAIAAYLRTADRDQGLTGEIALLVTVLLSALAQRDAVLAAGLGVVVAGLLLAKIPLHRFAREVVSAREMQDALLLAGAALVVLPLLPSTPVDPWGVLVPSRLWRLVVLVMGVGMLGHVSLRAVGARWGFPVAGFFAGFASSTAAIAGFGHRARHSAAQMRPAVGAALLANLASLALIAGVIGAGSPSLLRSMAGSLVAAGLVLLVGGISGLGAGEAGAVLPHEPPARAFRVSHALLLAALIAALLLVSAWLQHRFGVAGALVAAGCVALAEIHAATASLSQLYAAGDLPLPAARLGMVGLLAAASIAKTVVAALSGGWHYAWRVGLGLFASTLAAGIAALLIPS